MLTVKDACVVAGEYFKKELGLDGIAMITEDEESWFLSAGIAGAEPIGVAILAVAKTDAAVSLVDILEGENVQRLKKSTVVAVPEEFVVL